MSHYLPNVEHLNLCVLGENGTGKSSMIIQFVQSHFPEDHDPSLQDTYSRSISLGTKTTTATDNEEDDMQELSSMPNNEDHYVLDIVDTVGIEEYSELRENQIQEADAIILCYNVTSKQSYDIVTVLHQQVLRCRQDEDEDEKLPPIILCGTKSDLVDERQLSYHDGEILARELNLNFFIETSSKLNVNINNLFIRTAEEILKFKAQEAEKNSKIASTLIPNNNSTIQSKRSIQSIQPVEPVVQPPPPPQQRQIKDSNKINNTREIGGGVQKKNNDRCCIIM